MCIFNKPVKEVSGTKIFVSQTHDGRQVTVYQNYVDMVFDPSAPGRENKEKLETAKTALEEKGSTDNAMILPFPAGKIELINLEHCQNFFLECNNVFPKIIRAVDTNSSVSSHKISNNSNLLKVHVVGSYNISIATTLEDLDRIDKKVFIVSPNIKTLLSSHYANDFGFLICAFHDQGKKHPLCYVHTFTGKLFVPTRHEHGTMVEEGEEEEEPLWDHEIYSVNSDTVAGNTPEEYKLKLKEQIEKKLDAKKWRVADGGGLSPVITKFPVQLVKIVQFRLWEQKGKYPNGDLVWPENTSESEKSGGIVPVPYVPGTKTTKVKPGSAKKSPTPKAKTTTTTTSPKPVQGKKPFFLFGNKNKK